MGSQLQGDRPESPPGHQASYRLASRDALARVVASLLLCMVLPSGSSATSPQTLRRAEARAVVHGYGLGVTDVPDPPEKLARTRARPLAKRACPVEVRAIIKGDSPGVTFTIIGWGERSAVLAAGQGVRTANGWVAVSSIASDHVVLRRGGDAIRCPLESKVKPKSRER